MKLHVFNLPIHFFLYTVVVMQRAQRDIIRREHPPVMFMQHNLPVLVVLALFCWSGHVTRGLFSLSQSI